MARPGPARPDLGERASRAESQAALFYLCRSRAVPESSDCPVFVRAEATRSPSRARDFPQRYAAVGCASPAQREVRGSLVRGAAARLVSTLTVRLGARFGNHAGGAGTPTTAGDAEARVGGWRQSDRCYPGLIRIAGTASLLGRKAARAQAYSQAASARSLSRSTPRPLVGSGAFGRGCTGPGSAIREAIELCTGNALARVWTRTRVAGFSPSVVLG